MRYYIGNTQVKDIEDKREQKQPKDRSGIAKSVIVTQAFQRKKF